MAAAGGAWQHLYFCFVGDEALRLWRHIVRRTGPVFAIAESDVLIAQAASLVDGAAYQGQPATALSQALYGWLMQWLDVLGREADVPADLAVAQAYALQHVAEPIGVAHLARAAGLSRHHFSRRFAEHIGESPGVWLQRQRLERAARMLAGSDSIPAIAEACGFQSQSYFGKAFKKHWGLSPAVYRRRLG